MDCMHNNSKNLNYKYKYSEINCSQFILKSGQSIIKYIPNKNKFNMILQEKN